MLLISEDHGNPLVMTQVLPNPSEGIRYSKVKNMITL